MSYTPTTWTTGDTITASAMNKIENGIAGAGSALICTASFSDTADNHVLDKTVQEIYDALLSGTPAYIRFQYGVLGTDYISHLYLAPIIRIYSYNTTADIRIVASSPANIGGKSNFTHVHSPATIIFSASSMSEYPQKYARAYVPDANVNADASIL